MHTISKVFHHHGSNPPLPTSASNYHDDNPRRHKFVHSSKHRNITTSAVQTRNNSFSADGAQINDSKENLNETEDYSKRRERQQQRRLNEAMKEMEAAVEKAKTEALDLSHQSGKIGMDGKLLSSAPINIPKNTIINKAKIINAAAKKYPKSSKDSSTIQSKSIKRLSEPLNVIPERPATPGDNTLQSHQNSRENTLINDKQKQQEKEEIVSNMNLATKAERNFKLPFRGLIINSSGGKPAKLSSGTTKPGLDRAGNDDGANAKNKAESGDRDLGLNGKDEFVPREISAQRNNEENDTFSLADDDDDDEDGMPVDDFEEEDMEDEPENDDEEGEEEERDDDLLAADDDDKQEGSRQPKGLGRRYVRNSFDPRKNNALLNRRNHLLISQEAVSSPNPAHDSFTPNSYYSKPPSGIDMSSENDANQSYSHEPSLSLYPLMMVGSCPPSYHILSAKGDRESLLPCFEVVDKTVTETDHPVVENIELSQKLYPQINNAQLDDVEGSEEFGDIEQENNLKVEEEDPYPSNQDTLTSLAGVEVMPLFTRKRSCPSFQLRAVDSKDVILERKGSKGGAFQRQQRLSKIFSPASVFGINNKNRNNVMDLESGLLPSRHEIPYSSPSYSSSHHHLSRQFTNISRVISPSSLNLSHDNNNNNRQENNTVTPRNRRYSSPSKIQMAGQESTDVQNNTSQDTSDHWWEEKENPELYIIQDDFSSSPFSNANEFPAVSYNEITSMAQEESKKDVRSRSRNRFSLSRASACDGDEGFPRALTRDLSVHFEPTPHDNIKMDSSGGVIRKRIGQRIGQFFTRNNKYARERDRDRVSFRRRQRDAKATNEYNIVDNMNNHLSSNLVIPKTPGPEDFNAYNTTQNNECHVDFNNNVCERVAKIDAESPHPVLFRPDFDKDRSPIHPLLDITDDQVSNKVMPTLPPLAFQQLPCTNNDDGVDPPHDNHSNQVLQPTTTPDALSIIPSILNDSKDSLESQSSNDTINSLSALIHETSLTNHSIPTSS
ncbi:unnamed protein product [Gordionus sp. m RMFG-2023]|uniref:uncharacterized protein LOC135926122 n=1 Tax=Gordionus sp. m RMFG-2023 TaxID=3053472 RepID=UPI0030E59488